MFQGLRDLATGTSANLYIEISSAILHPVRYHDSPRVSEDTNCEVANSFH